MGSIQGVMIDVIRLFIAITYHYINHATINRDETCNINLTTTQ